VDRVCVMYAGKVVEEGSVDDVIDSPLHPYTAGLIGSVPSRSRRGRPLFQIRGMAPSIIDPPEGCAFRMRCGRADQSCMEPPQFAEVAPGRKARCVHPLMPGSELTGEGVPGQGKNPENGHGSLYGCMEGR
jgi:peptide/nickel transport system ATP-binding protein